MTTATTTSSGRGLTPTLLVGGLIVCSFVWASAEMTDAISMHGLDSVAEEVLKPVRVRRYGPDITHCNDAPDLWDCIRGE